MEQDFIRCEYKKVKVSSAQLALYLDAYESFGWQVDERLSSLQDEPEATLQLRRDRQIINRMELTRLQRNFEGCMEEIAELEEEESRMPTIASILVGLAGTAFLAGAVFAITVAEPLVWLCILLAIPGITGWVLPIYLFGALKRRKTAQITPLIEEKYDEIQSLMEKGHALLQ